MILMPSRLAQKVRSIDCHVVTGHTYVCMHIHITEYFARIQYTNWGPILEQISYIKIAIPYRPITIEKLSFSYAKIIRTCLTIESLLENILVHSFLQQVRSLSVRPYSAFLKLCFEIIFFVTDRLSLISFLLLCG